MSNIEITLKAVDTETGEVVYQTSSALREVVEMSLGDLEQIVRKYETEAELSREAVVEQ